MLMRVVLGWLRGERGHCSMVAIPTLVEEDAKRPSRERESLVGERTPDHQQRESWIDEARYPELQSCPPQGGEAAGDVGVARGSAAAAFMVQVRHRT